MATRKNILIINPNSTERMTEALKPLVARLNYEHINFTFFTAPSGPPSINNSQDCLESAMHCLPSCFDRGPTWAVAFDETMQRPQDLLEHLIPSHDAFLVACYSQHPLVELLKVHPDVKAKRKPVTGILEASVLAALALTHPEEGFGIVSTGSIWEGLLTKAVGAFLGINSPSSDPATLPGQVSKSNRFEGVATTGLSATELHDAPAEEVRRRMIAATEKLVQRGVGAICMGCAGMSGMEEMVREGCVNALGEEDGNRVRIIDGVVAGVAWLEGVLRWC